MLIKNTFSEYIIDFLFDLRTIRIKVTQAYDKQFVAVLIMIGNAPIGLIFGWRRGSGL